MIFLRKVQLLVVMLLCLSPFHSISQKTVEVKKLPPARVSEDSFLILNEVVTEQWPFMGPLINAPTNMAMLNPGQCIRAVALASGEGNEHYFDHASLSWTVRMGGKEDSFPFAATGLAKQIKPEGADFVIAVFRSASIKENPILSFVTMAASDTKWCVPQGAGDQKAEIHVTVRIGDQSTVLKTRNIQIESLASAAKKPFKDGKDFANFIQTYHVSPEPGRLLAAFQYLVVMDQKSLVPFAFFRAAFKHDEATVQGFGAGLTASPKLAEILALNLMAKAGVTLANPPPLTGEEKKSIAESADIPDGYDMRPTEELFTKLDFLWADFSATGRPRPVSAIVSALAWRTDFDAFDTMRKAGKKPGMLTESVIRGATYASAGWSLDSFQRNDPVAADYIEAIYANPSTPTSIKDELAHLATNPAFKQN